MAGNHNSGRRPKSAIEHALAGTVSQTRTNPREPAYPIEAPAKPRHVARNRAANAEWNRIVPILLAQRTISPAYRAALEAYVLLYAELVAGNLSVLPELRQWISHLGLTPATVSRVSAGRPDAGAVSPLAQLQARRDALHRVK